MAEASTTTHHVTPSPSNTNGTGTSSSTQAPTSPSSPKPPKNNNVRDTSINDSKSRGPQQRQNFNNRQNNNPPAAAGSTNNTNNKDKNPRRGKRANFYPKANNNNSSSDGGSVKASSQGGGGGGETEQQQYRPAGQTAMVNAGNNSTAVQAGSTAHQTLRPSASTPNGGGKSWSNVVAAPYGQPPVQYNGGEAQVQSHVVKHESVNHSQVNNNHNDNNKRQNRAKKGGNNNNNNNKYEEKKGKPEEADNFNPDEKIQAIQIQLDKTLNDMQAKADRVKQLQEQIKAIKVERDGKIDELNTERANLVEELLKLKSELSDTENQISHITATMTQFKSNRIQKVRSLVDHSRALLNDKAI